ncbi:MAG: hypothetical protein AB4911_20635 [Oscillochloridaceae bacterium umkhey_bin13]
MGLTLELQDDSGLVPLSAFPSEAKAIALALSDIPVIATLEAQLGLDLAPLRRVACDDEWMRLPRRFRWADLQTPDLARDALIQTELASLRAELDAVWQPLGDLQDAIERLVHVLNAHNGAVPTAVIAAVPAEPTQRSFVTSYLGQGGFAEDLAALRRMLRWANLRGATQVRLVVRETSSAVQCVGMNSDSYGSVPRRRCVP